jgi:hypothetical protein
MDCAAEISATTITEAPGASSRPRIKRRLGNLLNYLERVGNAACLEGIPDAIGLAAQFSRQHCTPTCLMLRFAAATVGKAALQYSEFNRATVSRP